MATAPLTASLTETLSKALNEKFYFGNILTKAQEVAALNPVFWGDSLEIYVTKDGSNDVSEWEDRSVFNRSVSQSVTSEKPTYIGNGFGSKGSFKDGELDLDPEPFNFTSDFAIGCWFKQDELTQFRPRS